MILFNSLLGQIITLKYLYLQHGSGFADVKDRTANADVLLGRFNVAISEERLTSWSGPPERIHLLTWRPP